MTHYIDKLKTGKTFLAPPLAQEVALCVCLSFTFMNISLRLAAISQQSLNSLFSSLYFEKM